MKAPASERDVKDIVRAVCKRHEPDLWFYMPAANGYGTPGIPDFFCAYKGHMLGIECKFGRGKQSEWQIKQEVALGKAGVPYMLVNEHTVSTFETQLQGWMALCS